MRIEVRLVGADGSRSAGKVVWCKFRPDYSGVVANRATFECLGNTKVAGIEHRPYRGNDDAWRSNGWGANVRNLMAGDLFDAIVFIKIDWLK